MDRYWIYETEMGEILLTRIQPSDEFYLGGPYDDIEEASRERRIIAEDMRRRERMLGSAILVGLSILAGIAVWSMLDG